MKETEKVPFDSMPPLIRGSFLTKEQAEMLKEPFKDVVSVTRCKDCKYGDSVKNGKGETMIECVLLYEGWLKEPDWFCADGEQK